MLRLFAEASCQYRGGSAELGLVSILNSQTPMPLRWHRKVQRALVSHFCLNKRPELILLLEGQVPTIPEQYKRVLEDKIDRLFERHLSSDTALASWLFRKVFGGKLMSIHSTELHQYKDYRKDVSRWLMVKQMSRLSRK
jgi:hypothetical protein